MTSGVIEFRPRRSAFGTRGDWLAVTLSRRFRARLQIFTIYDDDVMDGMLTVGKTFGGGCGTASGDE